MSKMTRILVAVAALTMGAPALAGRDQTQILQQDRAIAQKRAEAALAGPVGEAGRLGPTSESAKPKPNYNYGHPSERIRR